MIDITPILALVPDRVSAAAIIGDAIAEGRISVPDDYEDPDALSDAIVNLVLNIEALTP